MLVFRSKSTPLPSHHTRARSLTPLTVPARFARPRRLLPILLIGLAAGSYLLSLSLSPSSSSVVEWAAEDAPPLMATTTTTSPPSYAALRLYEANLPQHNLDLPFPEGRAGKYVRFSNQVRGLGWNNVLNELCVYRLSLSLGYR
jgi:hypothetical protein